MGLWTTDSYGDTDSLASPAAPAEEDGLDVHSSLWSKMVDREKTEEMSRLSDDLLVLMDDNSLKQVPPSEVREKKDRGHRRGQRRGRGVS